MVHIMNTVDTPVLAERYGNTRRSKVTGKLLVIFFVGMMVAAGIYIFTMAGRMSEADVTAVETGGSVPSDSHLISQIDITRSDANQPGYCVVQALDYAKAEVGRREVLIPAGGQRITRVELDIPTIAKAHAAKVYGCSATIPPHLTSPAVLN